MDVVNEPAGTTLTLKWPVAQAPPPVLALSELLFWVALTRIATRTDVRPVRVTAATPPAEGRAYEDYLGTAIIRSGVDSVTFSAMDENGEEYEAALAARRLRTIYNETVGPSYNGGKEYFEFLVIGAEKT